MLLCQVASLGRRERANALAIANISRQLTNTDKLHMSMLELLENVESIENKVDNAFPEFRKEISKLEVTLFESRLGVESFIIYTKNVDEQQKVEEIIASLSGIILNVGNFEKRLTLVLYTFTFIPTIYNKEWVNKLIATIFIHVKMAEATLSR